MNICIIGGGAAGFFSAITCAEANPAAKVTIFERGKEVLQKVRVSGGGRCNVTHSCFDARELVKHYPRGSRELLAPFLRFGPTEIIDWFAQRGVNLKTEADGRMFPTTDDSATIVNCLIHAAKNAGVSVETGARLEKTTPVQADNSFQLHFGGQPKPVSCDKLIVTTGSNTAIWEMLAGLGHTIVEPVPSLFTFNTKDTRLRDMSGVSVPAAQLRVQGSKLTAQGPLLITHWGLSGPAILRLSAWGARDLHSMDYRFQLTVNWLNDAKQDEVLLGLNEMKTNSGKKTVFLNAPEAIRPKIPNRLWQNLCEAAKIPDDLRYADMDKKSAQALAAQLTESIFQIAGKSTFKEEFVTAGGVDLKEVNFKTFESKLIPNLFFAGEVLNVDAITGGFNFQAAWTGGWIAGNAVSQTGDNTQQ